LCAQDRHHGTCPQSFQLENDANFIVGLHLEVQVKKYMLVELNGVDGIFQGSTKVFNSQKVIWILFDNLKCGQLTKIKNAHLYEHEIHPTWTPIEPISRIFKLVQIFFTL
jgi:hypothetical protein